MKNKIYTLSTCSTCARILKEVGPLKGIDLINIKVNNIEESDLDFIAEQNGSYEAVFSKRAMKYKSRGLKDKNLTEEDYKNLILEEYTFLKRPVAIISDQSYVGNTKKVTAQLKTAING